MAAKKQQTTDEMRRTFAAFARAHNAAPAIVFADLEKEARELADKIGKDDPRREDVDDILLAMTFARGHIEKGDAWWAAYELARAMRKSERLRLKSLIPLAELGERVREGGKKGAAAANQQRYEPSVYRLEVDDERRLNPDKNITEIRKNVAKTLGVSIRTVIRHTRNPKT